MIRKTLISKIIPPINQNTKIKILKKQTNLKYKTSKKIVNFVNQLRQYEEFKNISSLRSSIKFGKIIKKGEINLLNVDTVKKIAGDVFAYNDSSSNIVNKLVLEKFGGEN